MFLSLIHEGMCFLYDIHAMKIQLANIAAPIPMKPGLEAIVIIMYEEDVLVNFERMLRTLLTTTSILRCYGLPSTVDYMQFWRTGTPDEVAGGTALLAQVAHLPRGAIGADLHGRLKDKGRQTISASRGLLQTSFHSCWECFESPTTPPNWRAHKRWVENAPAIAVQYIDCERVPFAQMDPDDLEERLPSNPRKPNRKSVRVSHTQSDAPAKVPNEPDKSANQEHHADNLRSPTGSAR